MNNIPNSITYKRAFKPFHLILYTPNVIFGALKILQCFTKIFFCIFALS